MTHDPSLSHFNDDASRRVALVRQHADAPSHAESEFARLACRAWRELGAAPAVLSRRPCAESEIDPLPHIACNPWFKGALMRDWRFNRKARSHLARISPPPFVEAHEALPGCDLFWADGVMREWMRQMPRAADPVSMALGRISPFNRFRLHQEARMFASPWLRGVICGAERVKRELMRHYALEESKIHVIRHGVDTSRFHPGVREAHRQAVRARFGIPPQALVFLFAADDFHRHGLGQLLYAIHHATPPDSILVVAGADRRLKDYLSVSQWIHIKERTLFTGAWPDMETLFGACDALVLPTFYDPSAALTMEAMACGLPVITTPDSGAAEWMVHEKSGLLCDAVDEDALEEMLRRLLDADERARLGEGGRQAVAPFTLEAALDRILPLFQSLIDDHNKHPK